MSILTGPMCMHRATLGMCMSTAKSLAVSEQLSGRDLIKKMFIYFPPFTPPDGAECGLLCDPELPFTYQNCAQIERFPPAPRTPLTMLQ